MHNAHGGCSFSSSSLPSSSLKRMCLHAEGKILRAYQNHHIRKDTSEILIPTMVYREEWDVLRFVSVPLETKKFLSFRATSVTRSAVVLRFDNHVLQNLLRASSEHSIQ